MFTKAGIGELHAAMHERLNLLLRHVATVPDNLQHETIPGFGHSSLALGASQRTVQRALDSLASEGKVHWFGRARARRWITTPVPGFATILLLPAPLPGD